MREPGKDIRVLRTILVLVGLAIAGIVRLDTTTKQVSAQTVDAGAIVQQLFDAQDQGDIDGTMALYSDDVSFFGVPPCVPTACGRAAVQQRTASYVGNHGQDTIASMHVDGNIVSGRIETTTDSIRASGIQRIAVGFVAAVVDGKVRTLVVAMDTSDPQTAQYLAGRAAGPQQAPTPSSP
jgi:ketosteroid isomerase-like protein